MKHIVILCNSKKTPKNNLAGSHIDFCFRILDSKGILTVLLFYHIK
jgi:hypothetical protein